MISRLIFSLLNILVILETASVIPKQFNVIELNKGRTDIVDGDIALPPEDLELRNGRFKRQLKLQAKWTNGKVFYYFEPAFTSKKKELIVSAMNYISSRTCVTFEENRFASNRIKILNTGGCASILGMIRGEQSLWFSNECSISGVAVHELMHALGIYHTHSRYDRDDFLTVNLKAVSESMLSNFDKESSFSAYNAVPYEYGSTMHYAAGSEDRSLLPKDASYLYTLGHRQATFYDMVNINTQYGCSCPTNLTCKNGGYTNPSKCSECVCPEGFGGRLCDGPAPFAIQLTAASVWKGYLVSFGYNDSTLFSSFKNNYVFIDAPADKTIEVKIIKLNDFVCWYQCNHNGIELKVAGDPRITNPLICCEKGNLNTVHTSKQNPLPIVLYSRYSRSNVTIHYRYTDVPLSRNNKTTNGYDNYSYYA